MALKYDQAKMKDVKGCVKYEVDDKYQECVKNLYILGIKKKENTGSYCNDTFPLATHVVDRINCLTAVGESLLAREMPLRLQYSKKFILRHMM